MEVEGGAAIVDRHLPPLARLLVVAEALQLSTRLSGYDWVPVVVCQHLAALGAQDRRQNNALLARLEAKHPTAGNALPCMSAAPQQHAWCAESTKVT